MHALADFIRQRKDSILQQWIAAAAELPQARYVSRSAIADHMPDILDRLADAISRTDLSSQPLGGLSNVHAQARVREGYDVRQIVAEYRLLRQVIMQQYEQHAGDLSGESRPAIVALTHMHDALDRAITNAVDEHALERERARDLLISILSHDLRQPLNTIRFGADALWMRGESLDGASLKTAALIASSARRMEAMIHELLDFARGRLGGGLPVARRQVDAIQLVRDAVEEVAAAHPERIVQCRACQAADPLAADWDPGRVTQALSNLLANAITHGADPIEIDVAADDETISVAVRNQGEFPLDRLNQMFEPFAQRPEERRNQGLGLGLYIVREIAQAHGGRVSAASTNGHTTIALTLPRSGQKLGTS